LGCKEVSNITSFSFVNNPVIENLQFDFSSNQNQLIQYQIFNINDQILAKGTIDAHRGFNTKTIPLPNNHSGCHFLLLFNDNVKEVIKFIKLN